MAQTWNDTTLPWQSTSLPWKSTSMPWNNTSLPWKDVGSDPLAPPAPTLDLITASDTGSSSTDNITSDSTPDLDITFGQILLTNDVVTIYDSGVSLVAHTATSGEAAAGTVSLGLSALADGSHSLTATHSSGGHVSAASAALVVTVDTTAPTISTSGTQTVAENTAFSLQLAANETVTWTKTGGADTALFTLTSGGLLTMTAKNFESPSDADTNNTYVVQVTATDPSGNTTNKTITVTVTDVNEAPTVANAISNQSATVGAAFSFQFASNTFSDVDAGDSFTYTANSSGGALPAWLTFTSATRTFSGTPAGGDVGTPSITVVATDSGGLTASSTFTLTVAVQTGRQFVTSEGTLMNETNTGGRQWQSSSSFIAEN